MDEEQRANATAALADALPSLNSLNSSASIPFIPTAFFFASSSPPSATNAVTSVYMGNDAGGVRHVYTLPQGMTVNGLFYICSVKQLVCLADDNTMTTHAETDDGGWSSLTTMRFSSTSVQYTRQNPAAKSLLCVWTGAASCRLSDSGRIGIDEQLQAVRK
jgi:hypothetical protein